MKTIPYKKKITNSNTTYCETPKYELDWILEQCDTLVRAADTFKGLGRSEANAFNKPYPTLPKHGEGPEKGRRNSVKSFCEGIIDNFNTGQYNLSKIQIDGLQKCFQVGHSIFEDFEEITFEEVTQWPKIKLPESVTQPEPTDHFKSLFDYDIDIKITFTRKE